MIGKKTETTLLVLGGDPRIDFLPTEIKERKANYKKRRSLVVLVIGAAALCIGGYAYSMSIVSQAATNLESAQSETQAILKQQVEFAEAATIDKDLIATQNAKIVGSGTEILWKKYLDGVSAVLPGGAVITQYSIDSQSATDSAPTTFLPLEKPRVASMNFSVSVPSLPVADEMLVALETLPGFADATASSIAAGEDGNGFVVTVLLNINSEALEKRFFTTETDDGTEITPEAEATENEG